MANSQDIKRRISSVKNTKQITSAMKMVSSAKLRKAQHAVVKGRPYTQQIRKTLLNIGVAARGLKHFLLEKRAVKNSALIVITADKGLCGGYNAKIIKETAEYMKQNNSVNLIPVGKKGCKAFAKRKYGILYEIQSIENTELLNIAEDLTGKIVKMYKERVVDDFSILFTKFRSAIANEPEIKKLLPINMDGFSASSDSRSTGNTYYLEPAGDEIEGGLFQKSVMDHLLPKYIFTEIYGALLESRASEFGSRMVAMETATDNCEDIVSALTLTYNRVRQAGITNEIIEVSSGAEALK